MQKRRTLQKKHGKKRNAENFGNTQKLLELLINSLMWSDAQKKAGSYIGNNNANISHLIPFRSIQPNIFGKIINSLRSTFE